MRHSLTYKTDESWESVDTIIIDTDQTAEEAGERWYDNDRQIAKILVAYGVNGRDAAEIVKNRWWFIRNIDDVDFYITNEGELL